MLTPRSSHGNPKYGVWPAVCQPAESDGAGDSQAVFYGKVRSRLVESRGGAVV